VVVTYNRAQLLREALTALLAEPFTHIVVIDNASTDETPSVLDEFDDSRMQIHRQSANLGGAGGFHEGCRIARQLDVDWVLLQDDDARPESGFLAAFADRITRGLPTDVGGIAAVVRSPSGDIVEMNRPSRSPFGDVRAVANAVIHGRVALHVDDEAYDTVETDVDCVSFVGYLIRRDLIDGALGLPRAEFFVYADDQSYSYSLRRLGYRNLMVPSLRYVHECATYAPTGAVTPIWKVYYLYRNSLEFYREIAGRWYPLVVPFKLVAWTLRVRRYPSGQRLPYLRVAWRGVVDGLRRQFVRRHDDVVAFAESVVA
jgi:GT2 family glycosyltransferase